MADTEPEELLDRVRAQAVAFLTAVPRPPRVLRIRAGAVELDAEWPDAPTAGPVPGISARAAPAAAEQHVVTAPSVGVFYTAPAPDAPPFVRRGDVVTAGQQLGIVEVMKLMVPVEADRAGRIVAVCGENGAAVEYGDALFAIAPEGAGGRAAVPTA